MLRYSLTKETRTYAQWLISSVATLLRLTTVNCGRKCWLQMRINNSLKRDREGMHGEITAKGGCLQCKNINTILLISFSYRRILPKLYIYHRFRESFFAMGGGYHPNKIFRQFRGRDPSLTPILWTLGLKPMTIVEVDPVSKPEEATQPPEVVKVTN